MQESHCEKEHNPANTFANFAEMKDLTHINIRAMQLFLGIIEAGSFSEIARQEGMAASSVSRTLQLLEEALETQLLYRSTRAVVPTEEGRIYASTFRKIIDQVNSASSLVSERLDMPSGRIRFNAPVSFGMRHIAPLLTELSELYPKLRIDLSLTDEFINPLSDGSDLVLRIAGMKDSALHGRFIAKQGWHLAASPIYLDKYGTPASPQDLWQHHLLVYRGKLGTPRWCFSSENEQYSVSRPPKVVSDSAESLIRMAKDGAGIVLFPDWQIGNLLKSGQLTELLEDYQKSAGEPDQSIFMLYPGNKFPGLNTRTVIDFFLQKFGKPVYWKYIKGEPRI